MTTLEEIAKIAGVSRSTVSRVVNNNPRVKDATREKVKDVIREVKFQPSTAARRLAGGKSNIIGLVIPMGVARLFTDPYFPILLQSVSATCNTNNLTVMLWLAEPDQKRTLINQILNYDILDGVIVSSMSVNDPIISNLAKSHIPFVLVGRPPKENNIHFVDIDNKEGARKIVSHLIKSGKKRIGTITGKQNMLVSLDRLAGYRQALTDAGIEVIPELILDGNFTDLGGYSCTHALLPKKIDAIFAASDFMALGVLRALKETGAKIPEEIAVVGFDDAPFAPTTTPPLTTIHQPTDQLGSRAVELLVSLINNNHPSPNSVTIPVDIVFRDSG